jgi:hypothetical protein
MTQLPSLSFALNHTGALVLGGSGWNLTHNWVQQGTNLRRAPVRFRYFFGSLDVQAQLFLSRSIRRLNP